MIRLLTFVSFFLLTSTSFASPAVLIEEDGVDVQSLSQRSSIKRIYEAQEFSTTYELREKRRLGLGAQIAGMSGLYGIFAELNVNPSNSVLIGLGGGPSYSSFFGSWKYLYSESPLSPYGGLGYSHMYDASGGNQGLKQSNPRFVSAQLLTSSEKSTGRFQMDLLVGNIGLQYQLLNGPYVGFSFFVEADLLVRTVNLSMAPTGSVGSIYYF